MNRFDRILVLDDNTQMPHSAFAGRTPDEMYFVKAVDLPAQLAAARSKAHVLLRPARAGIVGGMTRSIKTGERHWRHGRALRPWISRMTTATTARSRRM